MCIVTIPSAAVWMLVHFGFSVAILRGAHRIAHDQALTSGGLEYSVHSSIVLM